MSSAAEALTARAVIFGCEGPSLSSWEHGFFRETDPFGFILFSRNCVSPEQVRALVRDLRAAVNRPHAPVLIDQEGGRVSRLKPPHWRAAPAAGVFGDLARSDPDKAKEAAWLNARLLASELAELGISVDCAPVLDLCHAGAHEVIGDRAYSADPWVVEELGRATREGLLAGGVLPVIKHVPGHGRALADSHAELPVVETAREILETSDFLPFRRLADSPWAMTAHVVYTAIDPDRPATTSATVIAEVIRGFIGFDGVLISDDISMEALDGAVSGRAAAALAAGCDLVLHCNGRTEEMQAIAARIEALSAEAKRRIAAAKCERTPNPIDHAEVSAQLERLMTAA